MAQFDLSHSSSWRHFFGKCAMAVNELSLTFSCFSSFFSCSFLYFCHHVSVFCHHTYLAGAVHQSLLWSSILSTLTAHSIKRLKTIFNVTNVTKIKLNSLKCIANEFRNYNFFVHDAFPAANASNSRPAQSFTKRETLKKLKRKENTLK